MVFMERFITNYLLCIHCYEIEKSMQEDQHLNDQIAPAWIELHRYKIMKVAMLIGSFVFMSYVQVITMMRPNLPTTI